MNKVLDKIRLKTFDEVRSSWELGCTSPSAPPQLDLEVEKLLQPPNLKEFLNSTIILTRWPQAIIEHLSNMALDNLVKRLPHLLMSIDSLIDLVDDSIAMPSYARHIFKAATILKKLILKKYSGVLKSEALLITEPAQPCFDVLDSFVQHIMTAMVIIGAAGELKEESNEPSLEHDQELQEIGNDNPRRASRRSSIASGVGDLKAPLTGAKEENNTPKHQTSDRPTDHPDSELQGKIKELLKDLSEERSKAISAFDLHLQVSPVHSDQT